MNRPTIANPGRCFSLALGVLALACVACSSPAQTAPAATAHEFIALADCPVTVPTNPYVGRAPYLAHPPEYYHSVWYGTDDLWTMLDPQGATFPMGKSFWWSRKFTMSSEIGPNEPLITVTGTRLDAPGEFMAHDPTNAAADFGTAMLVGVDVPSEGCWEIAAEYKGARLAYVVRVE